MYKRRALTQIEVVVIIIVVVLMVVVGAATLFMLSQRGVREHARSIACRNQLRQWGLIFKLYIDDNDYSFFNGEGRSNGFWWIEPLQPYFHDNLHILQCPVATIPYTEGGQNPFGAWELDDVSGSYAPNGWICNPKQGKTELHNRGPIENYWRGFKEEVRAPNNIPLLLDSMWYEAWSRQTDEPPSDEDWLKDKVNPGEMKANQNEMRRFCLNRHEGHINAVFLDYSTRQVGLKELWTLKWHRSYNTAGPWTLDGGVKPSDWPEWMRRFRDY
ncbi:MAG: hypothetical protein ACYS80_22665 [Planctomycetota bacterium]